MVLGDRATPTTLAEPWSEPVDLILVRTDYAPFTERPLPQGERIRFIDPSDESVFVRSLAALGIIEASAQDVA